MDLTEILANAVRRLRRAFRREIITAHQAWELVWQWVTDLGGLEREVDYLYAQVVA